ncbi:hypothetical protein [Streptantibioticus ferralitis]|uniref:Uncharacterized protein n=1 Tax=Streptantibioticus ferralitis TaxID=236510 RepID=A0ABT5YYK3_9ACTN|nr:hypothetical protein [Streptantibioticus ferralitis]MDF2256672.1 hypothetical protein [Streptantibioticus ferralitis]
MAGQFEIRPLGGHEYLLRTRSTNQMVETRLQLTDDDLEQLGVASADEARVVAATTEYLAEREPELDMPGLLDLHDIAETHQDFPERLRQRITSGR